MKHTALKGRPGSDQYPQEWYLCVRQRAARCRRDYTRTSASGPQLVTRRVGGSRSFDNLTPARVAKDFGAGVSCAEVTLPVVWSIGRFSLGLALVAPVPV